MFEHIVKFLLGLLVIACVLSALIVIMVVASQIYLWIGFWKLVGLVFLVSFAHKVGEDVYDWIGS